MRHEQLKQVESFDLVDVAAIWPRPDGGVQVPMAAIEAALPVRPATGAPDMPVALGRMIVGVYGILTFAATMARSGEALFMIAISGLYVLIFLAVPRIFFAVEADPARRPSFARFLNEGVETQTGCMSGGAALAQIFAVPVLVIAGVAFIGGAALVILP
jgi:hypothetical protein